MEFELSHFWGSAKYEALRMSGWRCSRKGCGVRGRVNLQVNHMVPVVGWGYQPSCYHHQDRLEVVCRDCHQVETNRQREERQGWSAEPAFAPITLPSHALPQRDRIDLLHRMLDRQPGFPHVLEVEEFYNTGIVRLMPLHWGWRSALSALEEDGDRVYVWEPEVQGWVTVEHYSTAELSA